MAPTKKKPSKNKPSTTSSFKPTARLSTAAATQKTNNKMKSTETKIPKITNQKNTDKTNDTKQKIPDTEKIHTTAETRSNPETQEQILIGFPNHLFKLETWDLNSNQQQVGIHFILYEHPIFYGHRQTPQKLNYNKSRLIYVRAAILAYLDYLKAHLGKPITINTNSAHASSNGASGQQTIKLLSVSFVSVDDCLANKSALPTQINKLIKPKQHDKSAKTTTPTETTIKYWDPVDCELSHKVIESQIAHTGQQISITKLDSPLFLTTEADLAEYHSKHATGRFTHSAFYEWQKTRPAHKEFKFPGHSYDTQNRGQMPLGTQIPPLPTITPADNKYLSAADQYISKHLEWGAKTRPGVANQLSNIVFPISHEATQDWFQNFLVKKLHKFGQYQDSIDGQARNYLFHSCISPMMNLGLITPHEVINAAHKYYQAHQSEVGVANYEGFIRQVIGWREYQRYIYICR